MEPDVTGSEKKKKLETDSNTKNVAENNEVSKTKKRKGNDPNDASNKRKRKIAKKAAAGYKKILV